MLEPTVTSPTVKIRLDDLTGHDVISLLEQHLDDMRATSPPESVHALDIAGLQSADVSFWSCWYNGLLVGCVALKELSNESGEIKSMRTSNESRRLGIGSTMLNFIVNIANERGYKSLFLETGSMAFFEPARKLYAKHGFEETEPFSTYEADPNSMFMKRLL